MRETQRKVILPLLGVLKNLKAADRIIILAHLDDLSRDSLYETINRVLSQSSPLPSSKKKLIRKKLWSHREDLRYLTSKKSKSKREKKRRLVHMGGNPLGYLLKAAVPLLLNLYGK